jgi:enoyl-CoA hydratase/carnithine racemase
MGMYKLFEIAITNHIAFVRMNRPPANAFNLEFIEEFEKCIAEAESNSSVRVVILTSRLEKIFSTGADIKMMFEMETETVHPLVMKTFLKIQNLPKPVIAMINGHALGGGCELAMCCDFRFMQKDSALIGLPEISLGIIPASGGTQRLPRLVGRGKAMELLLEGTRLRAEEALRIGLIHKVFSSAELEAKTMEYAQRLAGQAPTAMALIKKCVSEGTDQGLIRGLEVEKESLLAALKTEDAKEGVRAYLERRSPRFKGN